MCMARLYTCNGTEVKIYSQFACASVMYKLALRFNGRWMTCDFMSFSTVFQSYQDDEGLIMKGCVQ